MKVNLTPTELIDQLRAWFFPKDRSIFLANNCYIYLPGSYQLATARIDETTLSVAAPSIAFINIPQIFRSLRLVCQLRSDLAAEIDGVLLRFNGDTGANYDFQFLRANDTAVSADGARAQTGITIAICEAANSRANNFSSFEIVIPSYSLSAREKWATCSASAAFGNVSADTDMFMDSRTGRWRNQAVITNITLAPTVGANFTAGSVVTLYGIL